jgi:anti-sigma B factor antagonist
MLEVKNVNGVFVAKFIDVNRFNSVISQSVKDELNEVLAPGAIKLVLDLEGIKFVDSSAFGALISILKTSKETKSTFKICSATADVMELISVMQLDTVFEIHPSYAECIASFS